MPIFEFRCSECGEQFEKLFMNAQDEVEIACPRCQGRTCDRVVSRSSYVVGSGPGGNKPKITTRSCSTGSQCMTVDIPGPTK